MLHYMVQQSAVKKGRSVFLNSARRWFGGSPSIFLPLSHSAQLYRWIYIYIYIFSGIVDRIISRIFKEGGWGYLTGRYTGDKCWMFDRPMGTVECLPPPLNRNEFINFNVVFDTRVPLQNCQEKGCLVQTANYLHVFIYSKVCLPVF